MRLLICSVFACLLLISCGRKNSAGVDVDSKLKGFIPPKAKVLAGIDLDKIKKTDFYQRHQSQLALPQLNQLTEQTGVDPRRDLASFLMAWDGSEVLAMIHGSFDPSTLQRRLGEKAKAERYESYSLYGDGKRDVVFLPKGVALVGAAALVKRAISQNETGAGGVPEGLQVELAQLNKGAQAWFVSSGVISLDQLSIRADTAANLANISDYINGTAVGVTLSSGAALDAHIACISEEGSQRVHDALRGIIGLARLSTKDDQLDQLKIWDSIKVDKLGKDVHVTADLPTALADQLMQTMSGFTKRI